MGYRTSFELGVIGNNEMLHKILEEVDESFGGLNYAIDEYGESCDSVKWYDHEDDMKKLSLNYPEIVFVLRGEGEDNEDIWYKYFKNGKQQHCYAKITFDEYDESKLR